MGNVRLHSEKPIYTSNLPRYLKQHSYISEYLEDDRVCFDCIKNYTASEAVINDRVKHKITQEEENIHRREAEAEREKWFGKKYSYEGQAALANFIKTNGTCENCDLTGQDLLAASEKLTGRPEINLSGSRLTSIPGNIFGNYTNSLIENCNLDGRYLVGSNFKGAILWNVNAYKAQF
jgi:uncharacterized protein YjbI with pentapeptide repeats